MLKKGLIYGFIFWASVGLSFAQDANERMLAEAQKLFEEKKYSSAEVYLNTLLQENPENVAINLLKGKICFAQGKYQEAAEALEVTQRTESKNVEVLFLLAQAYQNLTRFQETITLLDQIEKLDIEYARKEDIYFYRGFAYLSLDSLNLAKKEYEQSLKLYPEENTTYYNLGITYSLLKDNDNACKYWQIAAQKGYAKASNFLINQCGGKVDFSSFFFVNDQAGMMSSDEKARLENKIKAYQDSTSTQISVITVNSLEGKNLEETSLNIAQTLGIGQKGKDNGILIFIARDERKIRIEVGYGLEGAIPDLVAMRIIEDYMTPEFRAGNVYKGVDDAVDVIMKLASGEFKADDLEPEWTTSKVWAYILGVNFFLATVFYRRTLFWALGLVLLILTLELLGKNLLGLSKSQIGWIALLITIVIGIVYIIIEVRRNDLITWKKSVADKLNPEAWQTIKEAYLPHEVEAQRASFHKKYNGLLKSVRGLKALSQSIVAIQNNPQNHFEQRPDAELYNIQREIIPLKHVFLERHFNLLQNMIGEDITYFNGLVSEPFSEENLKKLKERVAFFRVFINKESKYRRLYESTKEVILDKKFWLDLHTYHYKTRNLNSHKEELTGNFLAESILNSFETLQEVSNPILELHENPTKYYPEKSNIKLQRLNAQLYSLFSNPVYLKAVREKEEKYYEDESAYFKKREEQTLTEEDATKYAKTFAYFEKIANNPKAALGYDLEYMETESRDFINSMSAKYSSSYTSDSISQKQKSLRKELEHALKLDKDSKEAKLSRLYLEDIPSVKSSPSSYFNIIPVYVPSTTSSYSSSSRSSYSSSSSSSSWSSSSSSSSSSSYGGGSFGGGGASGGW